MSERGYIFLDRGIFDHPFFAREPYTELQAWAWMLHAAVWKPTRTRAGRKIVTLDRGELCFSERFLAEKWMWTKSRVRRFLNRCQSEAMVIIKTDRDATHITICNYNKYQARRTTGRTTDEPPTEPPANHSRTKEEELKKGKKEKITTTGAVADATRPDAGKIFDEQFWVAYPRREGANPKAPARKAFIVAVKSGADPNTIVSGSIRYAAAISKLNQTGTRYVAQAVTWLHQKRWEDYPDEVVVSTHGPPKPPDPRMPSHEELQRKYGASNADNCGTTRKGKDLRQEGDGVRREDGPAGSAEPPDDQAGHERMASLGEVLPAAFGLLPVGDVACGAPASGGERPGSDDGAGTMAGVVRH